jgi:Tol biopolymer transport system component
MTESRQRLDSWKAIAVYLKRDVTTVRRWERREGLPVHRHVHDKLGSVYAFADEIDDWSERRRAATAAVPSAADAGKTMRWPMMAGLVALVVMVLGAAGIVYFRPAPEIAAVASIAIAPPEGVTLSSMALSPTGEQVVLAGFRHGEAPQLWIKPIASAAFTGLPGTSGATFPFWSPDGRSVGFFAQRKLKVIDLATRDVRAIADAFDGRGGTWSQHGVILFSPMSSSALFQVPATGGTAVPVTTVGGHVSKTPWAAIGHAWPEFLPDGHRFVFLDLGGFPDAHGIYGGDLRTRETKRLVPLYTNAAYADGYLLYLNKAFALVAQRFDPERLKLSGAPVIVADDVLLQYTLDHKGHFSAGGGRLAVRHGEEGLSTLRWLDRSGTELARFEDAAAYSNPTLSPDGSRALVTEYATNAPGGKLWMITLATRQRTQMTFGEGTQVAPVWSPAEDRIMFASVHKRQVALFERPLTGGDDRRVPAAADRMVPEGWTRDARYLTYSSQDPKTRYDIWTLELSGDRRALPYANSLANEMQSQVSPDGRRIAYGSDESGTWEAYVDDFPSHRSKIRISSNGGGDPRWRADGGELYYISADRKLMAVPVNRGAFGAPRALFDLPVRALWADTRNNYDVSPDGQRFLAALPKDDPRSTYITAIVNWKSALRR